MSMWRSVGVVMVVMVVRRVVVVLVMHPVLVSDASRHRVVDLSLVGVLGSARAGDWFR